MTSYLHDPSARLDYSQDWTEWLAGYGSDTITAATATVTRGTATVTSVTHDDTGVTYWLSSATETPVHVTVHITTAGGREDERTDAFTIADR